MKRKSCSWKTTKWTRPRSNEFWNAKNFRTTTTSRALSKKPNKNSALKKYDVAVVDFNLGDGTCFDVFNALDETPFIIVTGGGSEATSPSKP